MIGINLIDTDVIHKIYADFEQKIFLIKLTKSIKKAA